MKNPEVHTKNILAINTAGSLSSVALFEAAQDESVPRLKEGSQLGEGSQLKSRSRLKGQKSWPGKNDEAEKLLPQIDGLLNECGLDFADIDEVFVVKGPGSFTGLRVGVSTANTIAYLNDCSLKAVDAFEFWWNALKGRGDFDGDISETALLIFAGSGGVYVSLNGENADSALIVDLPDLNEFLREKGIKKCFGDISNQQKELLDCEFMEIDKSFGEIVEGFLEDCSSQEKPLKNQKIIEPVYVKKPAITQSKNALYCGNANR